AAALRRELTFPGVGQTVLLTRIAQRASAMPPGEELAALGAAKTTLVLHLAVQRIDQVVGDIAAQVHAAGIRRTAVIIVGNVLAAEGFRDSHLYSTTRERSSSSGV